MSQTENIWPSTPLYLSVHIEGHNATSKPMMSRLLMLYKEEMLENPQETEL